MEVTLSNEERVVFRELNTGDIFDATDASKQVHVLKEAGPVFIIDHILLERLLILKSIVTVNAKDDIADINWLRNLAPIDYQKLRDSSEEVDAATLSEVGDRGRDSAASG